MQRRVAARSARCFLVPPPPEATHLLQALAYRVVVVDLIAESAAREIRHAYLTHKSPQIALREAVDVIFLDGVVRVHNHRNEQRQHDVDVEADEGVEIDAAEPPQHHRFVRHDGERREHVVAVNQSEETFGCRRQRAELDVIRTEDEPAAEGEAGVEQQRAQQEAPDVRQRLLQRQNHHVVRLEEAKVAQHAEPHQQVPHAQQQRAGVPLIGGEVLALDFLLDGGAENQQYVVEADHDVPHVDELPLAVAAQLVLETSDEEFLRLHAQLLRTEDRSTAQPEGQHADDDDEDIERRAERGVDLEVRLELHVALAEKPHRLRLQRHDHLPIVVGVVEEDLNVEAVAVGRGDGSAGLQVHRLDGEVDGRFHQRGELNEDVLRVEKLLDAAARVVLLQRLAARVDLRVEDVALVEAEHDALLVLVQAKLHRAHLVVIGGVRVGPDGPAQVAETVNCVIDGVEIFLDGVHRQRAGLGRVRAHLKRIKLAEAHEA